MQELITKDVRPVILDRQLMTLDEQIELVTLDGQIAGKIIEKGGTKFIIVNDGFTVMLNGRVLNARNRFGKVRPYILNDTDELKW